MYTKELSNTLTKIIKDPALSGTLIVTLGVFAGSIFSYALQFILSKYLTLPEFGTFNALLSLNTIFGVFILVFSTALIRLTSELKAKDQFNKLTSLFWKLTLFAMVFFFLIFLTFVFAKKELAQLLNISDPNLFTYFSLTLGMSVVITIPAAYLQGLLRFKAYAFFMFVLAFLRFLIPTGIVLAGFKVDGIFLGMFISLILTYFISLILLKKNFKAGSNEDVTTYFKQLFLFSIPVFFVNIGMNLLNNIDVILVKKFFSETDTGIYAGIVTIGKILLFGAGTVSAVMFPQISTLFISKVNYFSKFRMFLTLQLVAVFGGIIFCFLFPHFLALMFTPSFLPAVPYIPRFSIFMGLYVLLNFMVLFLLAINKTKVFAFLIPGVILQFVLLTLYHSSLVMVININIIVTAILLLSVILYTVANVGLHNRSRI